MNDECFQGIPRLTSIQPGKLPFPTHLSLLAPPVPSDAGMFDTPSDAVKAKDVETKNQTQRVEGFLGYRRSKEENPKDPNYFWGS